MPLPIHVYTLEADGRLLPVSPAAVETPYSASDVINFLTKHIPCSLPILRRLQLGPRGGQAQLITTALPLNATGIDPQSSNEASPMQAKDITDIDPETVWAMAFVDRGNHPATEIWPFSSLELYHGLADYDKATQAADVLPSSLALPFAADVCKVATSQLLAILSNIKVTSRQPGVEILDQFKTSGSPCVLAGNVHTTVAALLAQAGLGLRPSQPYGKYLFPGAGDSQALVHTPDGSSVGLPDGLQWSRIGPGDYADVMAVNKIVRSAQTIANLPSAAIREVTAKEGSSQGKAVAFAFAAGDGSVRTPGTIGVCWNREEQHWQHQDIRSAWCKVAMGCLLALFGFRSSSQVIGVVKHTCRIFEI
jgi:hypothetical protein